MILSLSRSLLVFLLASITLPCQGFLPIFKCVPDSLDSSLPQHGNLHVLQALFQANSGGGSPSFQCRSGSINRRDSLSSGLNRLLLGATITIASPSLPATAATTPTTDTAGLRQDVQQALRQLNDVPNMIEAEQWDAVRNLLVTPPFSVFRKASAPWWQDYANAVEANGGDEFQVLELKEELQGHLQSLDMAVYNNVFNPIKTQGQTGATKQLVQSYYEDPTREYKATKAALEELAKIGGAPS